MDEKQAHSTTGEFSQPTFVENAKLSPMAGGGAGFNPSPEGNSTELRAKRRIYTFIQIIGVVLMLISMPLMILGIINIGPQLGKTAEVTATITEISADLAGIIDETVGVTDLSNGCRVHYEFINVEKTHKGSSHSTELCNQPIGSEVAIVYSPTNPIDNTIAITWKPYDTFLITGGVLLVVSLFVIIGSSIMKRKTPKPAQNRVNYPPQAQFPQY